MTNDSWYGQTHEPIHHMAMSTFRSIETRRSLIRSTNTGISVLVDPLGRITARTAMASEAVLIGDVALVEDGSSTPYLYWWDTLGRYHQHYVSGGQIIHVSDQPMAFPKIILSLDEVSEP